MQSLPDDSTLYILRVVAGVLLGLLTVYRREMSCNREYQDRSDEFDPTECEVCEDRSIIQASTTNWRRGFTLRDDIRCNNIRRRASSSSLPTLCNRDSPTSNNRNDPTEELLESAGFMFSGGPFLAVTLAVLDHLILTVLLASLASAMSWRWNDRIAVELDDGDVPRSNEQTSLNSGMNQRIHQVAWNAATDYFNSISSKLDYRTEISADPLRIKKPTRSKSANNISQISEGEYVKLVTIARGHSDISLLPSETKITIFSFLHPKDLLSYTCTSRNGARMLDDAVNLSISDDDKGNVQSDGLHSLSERDTAILIWKHLFQRDYAWVLKDWEIGREALQRSMDVLISDNLYCESVASNDRSTGSSVISHILSTSGVEYHLNDQLRDHAHTSMKDFYFTFNESWLNWIIAGCNSTEKCLIGLHGHIFDISDFVEQHPGSTETLLLQAGRDATLFFETMGHSLGARRLALGMCTIINSQCIHWDSVNNRNHEVARLNEKKLCYKWGLIKPSCPSLQSRKSTPGFIIPGKRSKPHTSGGLLRIREKLNREISIELTKADRWGRMTLGIGNLFGGVQVYFDPICCKWRWWYTDLNFDPVFISSVD